MLLHVRARRSPRTLHATGPLAHALNGAMLVRLMLAPATAGAAFLFYGASMSVRRRRAGERVWLT